MPVHVVLRLAEAAGDTRLQRSDVLSLAMIARYSDHDGMVGADENGMPMSDPSRLARKMGSGLSTVRKSFAKLEDLGYLQWQRGWPRDHTVFGGVTGKVRILPLDPASQS